MSVQGFVATLRNVVTLLAMSVAAVRDRYSALTASAVFLITFLIVHALGNTLIFMGQDALNLYGHKLVTNPVIRFIEWYLLGAFMLHVAAAAYISVVTGKYARVLQGIAGLRFSSDAVVMSVTGSVLLVFVVVHLGDFKFADIGTVEIDGEHVRDLYTQQLIVLGDPGHFLFYVTSVLCMALHLMYGWRAAIGRPSLGLPPQHRADALLLGYLLLLVISLCFLAAASRSHFGFKTYTFTKVK
eukprot:TRINITY_DN29912_c0_g1_i1.p1 TRINITY_DN29912_c0_g1~~TRINITY_DN29912_c0_g1_i1.p1  ORF type:complete len:251 (+),score=51.94 TRINITY_DN29912_c0_g1_i1:29-754(+)